MEHIHIFYSPASAYTMEEVSRCGSGMTISDPSWMLYELTQTHIKKILRLLVNNDVRSLENVMAFDECLCAEADAEGLFDEDRQEPLTSYGKKLAKLMEWWDGELSKRDISLRCGAA